MGLVFDWPAAQTGWVQALGLTGVAPVKKWNASRARFEPRPPGDKWQKGFLVRVAYAPDAAAAWEQWGAGAWMGFAEMFVELMTSAFAQLPNLPLLIPISPKPIKFAQGPSLVPKFKVSRYVPRPSCLPEGDASPPQIAMQPQQRAQVSYSNPTTQLHPLQSATPEPAAQPSTPARPAPIQPAGWDEPGPPPVQESTPPSTANKDGTVVPILSQEPSNTQSDALIDPHPGF
jgi:hypothetical protein